MTGARTRIVRGSRILTNREVMVVRELTPAGVVLVDQQFGEHFKAHVDIGPVFPAGEEPSYAVQPDIAGWWSGLSGKARKIVLFRLEVVLELTTLYRSGHALLARPDEPRLCADPRAAPSRNKRAHRLAELLKHERNLDREYQRRITAGEIKAGDIGASTLRRWVTYYEADGLRGLEDGRGGRRHAGQTDPTVIPPAYADIANEVISQLNGDVSTVNNIEVRRRILVEAKERGLFESRPSLGSLDKLIAQKRAGRGATTRAQRTESLRDASWYEDYAVTRPGQVIAIDATRADIMVWDERTQSAVTCEILTAIDVFSRVILAIRVTPRSANALELGLLLFDVMCPWTVRVSGTDVRHWRWPGLPEVIDMRNGPLIGGVGEGKRRVDQDGSDERPLDGEYEMPAVMPDAVRVDNGSINLSEFFLELLRQFEIDLIPSRPARPTDNPHVERLHETYQDVVQRYVTSYKGRNPTQRGRKVGKDARLPIGTAAELEEHLLLWAALKHNVTEHEGLKLAADPDGRCTPIQAFDAGIAASGRIDVPTQPAMLYNFLPVQWHVVGHSGFEKQNLTYDAPFLEPYRHAPKGTFREKDGAVPFFYDRRDVTRLWFRDPSDGVVKEVPWRGAHRIDGPMNDVIRDAARKITRERGRVLGRDEQELQIIEAVGQLVTKPKSRQVGKVAAAAMRVAASRKDHEQAQVQSQAHAKAPLQAQASDTVGSSVNGAARHRPMPLLAGIPSIDLPDGVSILDDAWPEPAPAMEVE